MRKQQKAILVLVMITVFVATAASLPGLVRAGDWVPPTDPPGPTMHTLDEIYEKVNLQGYPHAPVAKTGQTTSYAARDDGYLQKGMAWPDPRFTDHGNGTVTDNLTGLMWTKDADMYGTETWTDALSDCATCTTGGYSDWRLPHVRELQSLIDYGQYSPVLPDGHPFTNVRLFRYWSSSTFAFSTVYAWHVALYNGYVRSDDKGYDSCVWCVRGGQ